MGKFTFRLFFTLFICFLFYKGGNKAIAQVTTQIFNYTGGNQTFVVPPCVTSITVQCWGGGVASGGGNCAGVSLEDPRLPAADPGT